jgi:hypothetical protein
VAPAEQNAILLIQAILFYIRTGQKSRQKICNMMSQISEDGVADLQPVPLIALMAAVSDVTPAASATPRRGFRCHSYEIP